MIGKIIMGQNLKIYRKIKCKYLNIIQLLYMDNIFIKINNLYNKKGFMEKYGLDVWTSAIIILVFFIVTTYFYILNHIKPIKANWSVEKCNPAVIPFAGLINGKSGIESIEFTGTNFTGCVQTILQNIAGYAIQPFYYTMSVLNEAVSDMTTATNSMRSLINKIRNSTKDFTSEIMGRSLNITLPLIEMIISTRDVIGKTTGTMTAALYTLFGSYLALQSALNFVIELIYDILLGMAATIIGSWIAGFFFPPADIIAITTTAFMVALLVPFVIVEVLLNRVMNIPTPSPPGIPSRPSCFSGKTIVKLINNNKLFKDLEIGDVMEDGSIITSIFKLSSANEKIYKLNDIIVSGTHRVFYENFGWITVDKHPESILINDFKEPYLYCINTNRKIIKLNNYVFLDWDELDRETMKKLTLNCIRNRVVPIDFKPIDIHYYLGLGLQEDMKIELKDGRSINIKDIEVNDILKFGEKVYGIVKIDGSNIRGVYEYYLENEKILKSTKHIIIKDSTLGNINTKNLSGTKIDKPKYLYHLLTNVGTYVVNDIRIGDYNTGIETYINNNDSPRN